MEPTPSTTLLEDAVATLESIRRAVLLDLQQPGNNGIYEEMPGEIERLRSQIEGSADEDIAESLDELELLASKASETGLERAKLDILDVISSLEAILVDPDLSENELLELVDASFDAFAGVPKTDAVPEEEPVLQLEAATEDELDLELIEVFAEESEQLLSSFEEQLNRLRSDNTNKVPMWELRRIAHTFKGAAGVVGLRTAADLAHRIESGLDNLSTLPEEKLTSLLQVLEPCVDVLRGLAVSTIAADDPRIRKILTDLERLSKEGSVEHSGGSTRSDRKNNSAEPAATPDAASKDKKSVVRVSLAVLDQLDRRMRDLAQALLTAYQELEPGSDPDELAASLTRHLELQLSLANSVKDELRSVRMVEFGTLTTRLQRAVRVACEEEQKTAEIHIENAEIKLDTVLLDSLVEPLLHLLRNAVVHGIESAETRRLLGKPESGMIRLRLSEVPGRVEIALSDDGGGIDVNSVRRRGVELGVLGAEKAKSISNEEALDLVFHAGLSTATKLTLQAGRGVGMKIVRDAIHELNGVISIDTSKNSGTTFTIKLPKFDGNYRSHSPVSLERANYSFR
jgi:two-component system chemotaxis sensor kinase CheA